MTTTAPHPPAGPPAPRDPAPSGRRGRRPAEDPGETARTRRRRRLLLASAPVVVVVLLVALRLLTLGPMHDRALAAYERGDRAATVVWGERLGWVDVVERFRAPFVVGDGFVLGGQWDQARLHFEESFALVPRGGIEECKVRVNLALTYEELGDEALARERVTEWRQFYEKARRTAAERPALCDLPEEGEGTGRTLRETQDRVEQKNPDTNGSGPQEQPGPQPPTPQVTPTPDTGLTPSPELEEELRRQQRENTAERNRQLGNEGLVVPDEGSPETYPRPW